MIIQNSTNDDVVKKANLLVTENEALKNEIEGLVGISSMHCTGAV